LRSAPSISPTNDAVASAGRPAGGGAAPLKDLRVIPPYSGVVASTRLSVGSLAFVTA